MTQFTCSVKPLQTIGGSHPSYSKYYVLHIEVQVLGFLHGHTSASILCITASLVAPSLQIAAFHPFSHRILCSFKMQKWVQETCFLLSGRALTEYILVSHSIIIPLVTYQHIIQFDGEIITRTATECSNMQVSKMKPPEKAVVTTSPDLLIIWRLSDFSYYLWLLWSSGYSLISIIGNFVAVQHWLKATGP